MLEACDESHGKAPGIFGHSLSDTYRADFVIIFCLDNIL